MNALILTLALLRILCRNCFPPWNWGLEHGFAGRFYNFVHFTSPNAWLKMVDILNGPVVTHIGWASPNLLVLWRLAFRHIISAQKQPTFTLVSSDDDNGQNLNSAHNWNDMFRIYNLNLQKRDPIIIRKKINLLKNVIKDLIHSSHSFRFKFL